MDISFFNLVLHTDIRISIIVILRQGSFDYSLCPNITSSSYQRRRWQSEAQQMGKQQHLQMAVRSEDGLSMLHSAYNLHDKANL